jgi:hypothetical protein
MRNMNVLDGLERLGPESNLLAPLNPKVKPLLYWGALPSLTTALAASMIFPFPVWAADEGNL